MLTLLAALVRFVFLAVLASLIYLSIRAGRASLLLDLAAFVEEGEDDFNALGGIAEGEEEEEEEDEYDDFGGGGGGGGDDLDDVDILGVASGETSTI